MSIFYHVVLDSSGKWIKSPNNGGECCTTQEDTVETLNKLIQERDALQARVKRLEDALELVLKMHNDWLEMQEDGYAGAYYAFVKGNDDEWGSIIKAKESKP